MTDKTASLARECPIQRVAGLIGDKWTLLLIRDLSSGRQRFIQLQNSMVGISSRTLAARLSVLEHAGLIERHAYAEMPPRVEYDLTEKGRALVPLIEAMRAFGEKWFA